MLQILKKAEPETLIDSPEQYARTLLTTQLEQSEALTIIANTLNSLERKRDGLPLCRLADRSVKDMQRLVARGRAIVRLVHDDVVDAAIEEVAIVICEGGDGEYSKLEDQLPSVQAKYVRWAQTAVNAYWHALEQNWGRP